MAEKFNEIDEVKKVISNLKVNSETLNCQPKPEVKNRNLKPTKEITILLLGETGVGKSTFINAFANYLLHEEMEIAAKNLLCLIPLEFTITDENFKMQTVKLGGGDSNESLKSGESSTQTCRCYIFSCSMFKINIIDTPGIGDTRGVDKDSINIRNLLDFIANYKEINSICVLLKPNNARADVLFKYCILELLKNLNKSASQNIVFVFTNSRSTFYRPGDSGPTLSNILGQINSRPPYVNIKYDKENVYCFDNEAFRFLVADSNGIKFSEKECEAFKISWERSLSECKRMMQFVNQLKPHQVQDTISINNARTTILSLTQPLGDTAKLLADNIKECEGRRKKIFEFEGNVKDLQGELFIPTIDLESKKLDKPMTVCGDSRCCETINIKGTAKTHYKTICHNPCYLTSSDGNVIGNTGLLDCQAFNKYTPVGEFSWKKVSDSDWHPDNDLSNTNENGEIWSAEHDQEKSDFCFNENCGHSYQTHLHIFTKTKIINKRIRDEGIFQQITNRKDAMKAQQTEIKKLEERIKRLEKEQAIITECTGKFAHFLQNNAITAINDAFEEYLKHLIKNEKNCWNNDSDKTIESLNKMLFNHQYEKEILMKAMKQGSRIKHQISKEDIDIMLKRLFRLEISGPIIKQCFDAQLESQRSAHTVFNEVNCKTVTDTKSSVKLSNRFKKWFNFF